MRINVLVLAICLLAAFFAGEHFAQNAKSAWEKTATKSDNYEKVPDFEFVDLNSNTYNITEFRSNYIILNFWASWCIPCKVEFPILLDIAAEHSENLTLILLSSDREKDDIIRFLESIEKQGSDLSELENVIIAHDQNKKITHDLFNTIKLPETILVDPTGDMIKKVVGVRWAKEDITGLIEPKDLSQ